MGAGARTSRSSCSAAASEVAAAAGLILADTKYEFGLTADGELLLIDEVHTPDSSRFWVADTYEERLAAGEEPESLDKEVVRRALADAGYTRRRRSARRCPPRSWTATSARYIDAYERLTGLAVRARRLPRRRPDRRRLADILDDSRTRDGHQSTSHVRHVRLDDDARARSAACSASRRRTARASPS